MSISGSEGELDNSLFSFEVLTKESDLTMSTEKSHSFLGRQPHATDWTSSFSTTTRSSIETTRSNSNSDNVEIGDKEISNFEDDMKSTISTAMAALDELTAPYECRNISTTTAVESDIDTDEENKPHEVNDDKGDESSAVEDEGVLAKIDEAKSFGERLRKSCREEQNRLKNLISSARDSLSFMSITEPNQDLKNAIPGASLIKTHLDGYKNNLISGEESNHLSETKVDKKMSFGNNKSVPVITPQTVIHAVLWGFVVSFLLFLCYTLVFEAVKHQQIIRYENMTNSERAQKEVYRQGEDNLREVLMHKSYEESRKSSDALLGCQKSLKESTSQISLMEKEIMRFKYDSRAKEDELTQKIQRLEADLINQKVSSGAESQKTIKDLKRIIKQLQEEHKKWNGNISLAIGVIVSAIIGLRIFSQKK